jgi:hypothetical protein
MTSLPKYLDTYLFIGLIFSSRRFIVRLTTRPGFAGTIPVCSSPSWWQTSTSPGHWSVPFCKIQKICAIQNILLNYKLNFNFFFPKKLRFSNTKYRCLSNHRTGRLTSGNPFTNFKAWLRVKHFWSY